MEGTGQTGRLLVAALALAACAKGAPEPLRAHGTVEAREVRVASRASGRVANVLVDEGDHVRAGAPLVELDLSELEAQRAEAQAAARGAAARERALLSGQPQDV
uniref:biotin/lipoyl-binding protein n=1 Tax=Anaeromyxobacter terrae TaxID=2925406 RepID=UPI001F56B337